MRERLIVQKVYKIDLTDEQEDTQQAHRKSDTHTVRLTNRLTPDIEPLSSIY